MKKNIILLFVVLLGLSWYSAISSSASGPKEYNEHLEKAEDLEQRGIYIGAIDEYNQILKGHRDDVNIMMRIADDYLLLEDKNEYISTLKNAIEMQVDGSNDALDKLMNYFLENDEEGKACKYILELVEKEPKDESVNAWLSKLSGTYRILYCNYDEMFGMFNDNMVVRSGDKYAILDTSGSRMLELKYSMLTPFTKDGYSRTIGEADNVIYIDEDGYTKVVPSAEYNNLGILNDSRIVASSGGKYGYLDENGEPVTEICWDELTSFNKVGLAKKNNKWAIVGSKGNEKTEYIYDGVIVDQYGIACNQSRIFVKSGDKYKLVDTKGKDISDLTFDDARIFGDKGYAAVCINGKWGFVDANGKLVIQNQYDEAESFSNGFAAVKVGELWGYINKDAVMIVSPSFSKATAFSSEGTAAVLIHDEEYDSDEWNLIKLNIK